MISKNLAKIVRKGDLSKIENYNEAIADDSQIWVCHHRLELTLDGEFAHSAEELKRLGMYFNRPYFELIFLKRAEHTQLHKKGQTLSEEHIKKIIESRKNTPYFRSDFGKKYFEHFGYYGRKNLRLYNREASWYRRHNNRCSWE